MDAKAKMDERVCVHCKGLISIRMPVPSSGCDHLYYPESCEVCQCAEYRKIEGEKRDEQYICVVHSSPACNECVNAFRKKEEELDRLREELNQIKNYSPVSARGCAMCKYEDGVFVSHCAYHKELEDLRAQCKELRREIEIDDELLAEQDRLLKSIPRCLDHGDSCIHHAVEWVERAKTYISKHEGK